MVGQETHFFLLFTYYVSRRVNDVRLSADRRRDPRVYDYPYVLLHT
jgi:hypothetical protein